MAERERKKEKERERENYKQYHRQIENIWFCFVLFGFMTYQTLEVIQCQILFKHVY